MVDIDEVINRGFVWNETLPDNGAGISPDSYPT